jgi:AcrR family transcriptional regulator
VAQLDEADEDPPRERLNRERVLQAAVALADRDGLEAVSMRNLAERLGVVPMALYKHVASKDELLDGMVDVLLGQVEEPEAHTDWKPGIRGRVLSMRMVLVAHPWGRRLLESRTAPTPAALDHLESLAATFVAGGFSFDLTHHVMHALGSRMWGFSPELFDAERTVGPREVDTVAQAATFDAMADRYPVVVALARDSIEQAGPRASEGCDEQLEFELALDVLLDGFERLFEAGWSSAGRGRDLRASERT